MAKEQEVLNFINDNYERTVPFPTSDLNRLTHDNPLLKPIENHNIRFIIQKMKDKAPGQSGIRKSIMEKMPSIAIDKLKNIYNHSLSMDYFPDLVKKTIMFYI